MREGERTYRKGHGQDQGKDEKPVAVEIDLDNIGQRLLVAPLPARNYTALQSRKAGVLFLVEGPESIRFDDEEAGHR